MVVKTALLTCFKCWYKINYYWRCLVCFGKLIQYLGGEAVSTDGDLGKKQVSSYRWQVPTANWLLRLHQNFKIKAAVGARLRHQGFMAKVRRWYRVVHFELFLYTPHQPPALKQQQQGDGLLAAWHGCKLLGCDRHVAAWISLGYLKEKSWLLLLFTMKLLVCIQYLHECTWD